MSIETEVFLFSVLGKHSNMLPRISRNEPPVKKEALKNVFIVVFGHVLKRGKFANQFLSTEEMDEKDFKLDVHPNVRKKGEWQ